MNHPGTTQNHAGTTRNHPGTIQEPPEPKILIFHLFFKVLGPPGTKNIYFSFVFFNFCLRFWDHQEPKILIFHWFFHVFGARTGEAKPGAPPSLGLLKIRQNPSVQALFGELLKPHATIREPYVFLKDVWQDVPRPCIFLKDVGSNIKK